MSEQTNASLTQQIYPQLDRMFTESDLLYGASGVHGLITALISAGVPAARLASRQGLMGEMAEEHLNAVEGLFALVERDLQDETLTFTLLLPSDDEPMETRLEALAEWCQGFIDGLGNELDSNQVVLSNECYDALSDLQHISEIAMPDEVDEEAEKHLQEVIEYVRIAAMLVYEELAPNQPVVSNETH